MRARIGAAVLVVGCVAAWLTFSLTTRTRSAEAFVRAEIRQDHWKRHGFVEMVPPVRLPTTRSDDGDIHVWLKLPDGARVATADTPQGPTLDFPPGTTADRVELIGDVVSDVRGTTLLPDGEEFHVYVPRAFDIASPLAGFSWRRGDTTSHALVTDELIALLRESPLPPGVPEDARAGRLTRYRNNNACARCHLHDKRETADARDLVHRRTDHDGFFVPLSVLFDDGIVERHRPRDPNLKDPFVTLRCARGEVTVMEQGAAREARCQNGEAVRARLDVRAALAAGDAHADAVCNARRYLRAHMDDAGRARFAEAFSVCGLE